MRVGIGLCALVLLVGGCSAESVKRTGYETLESMRRQQCLDDPAAPDCPPRQGYDAYQREREDNRE